MINAEAAGAHRFGRVKRNGYDPAEVDAVVSRLVDELRTYESKIADLEQRLAEADISADAIRQTFLAAEKTRDEIVNTAKEESDTILDDARAEAEDVLAAARSQSAEITASAEADAQATAEIASRLEHEVARRRDELLTEAEEQAEAITTKAEAQAADRVAAAVAEADELRETMTADIATSAHVAAWKSRAQTIASAWTYTAAVQRADQIVGDARIEAEAIVNDAREDSAHMQERMVALRAAVAGLEQSARNLAAMTAEEAAVIDLSEIEGLEAVQKADVVPITEDLPAQEPEPVMSSVGIADEPLIFEAAEKAEAQPLLTVAEAQAELEREAPEPEVVVEETPEPADEPEDQPTYYQRTTGTPLSERVKIARKSG